MGYLDALARALVFERDGHKCVRCGKGDRLQWAHVHTRAQKSLRWRLENSMVLCAGCHLWWHHHPLDAGLWFNAAFYNRCTALQWARSTPQKVDMGLIRLWLEQEAQRLGVPLPSIRAKRGPDRAVRKAGGGNRKAAATV